MPIGFFGALGQQAAGQATGGAIAMGLQRLGANFDTRTMMDRQRQSMAIQMQGEKEMLDYQKQKDLETLTNSYGAQMKGLTENGLNPALMYGMQGGGGTTGGSTPSVSGGGDYNPKTAQGGSNGMAIMNAAQIQLLEAQADQAKANAEATRAGIPNLPKVGANLDASTQSILTGINNQKAQKALTDAQARLTNIQANVAEESQDDAIQRIHSEALAAIGQARTAMAEGNVDQATQDSKIEILKQQAVGAALENALTQKTTEKTGTAIKVDKAQIAKMAQDVAQGWEGLSIKLKEARVNGVIEEYKAQFQGHLGAWKIPDPKTMAAQIDEILNIRSSDFKDKQKKQ